jgi:hypothetical protein
MKKIIVALAILVLISCAHSTTKNDKNLVPKDKMIQILIQLQLTEANTDPGKVRRDEKEMEKLAVQYQKVFNKNGVKAEDFYSTFNYLLNHPTEMDSTYKDLVTESMRQESKLYHAPNGVPEDSTIQHRPFP